MIEYTNKCTGCTACKSICKFNAIKMEDDKNGFKYPIVNKDLCVNCGECERICPLNNKSTKRTTPKAFACYNKDKNIRLQSSSGGIFSIIATKILASDGVVYGAAFDEKYNVKHIEIEKIEEIEKLRGSKYVQSNLGETFKKIKTNLDEGKKVLFTGTPCQVAGLLNFLKREYSNLYTLDFICHGTPSPKVWKKYLEFRKKEDNKKEDNKKEISGINFREKSELGWEKFAMNIKYTKGEYTKIHSEDLYMKAFLGDVSLRESCYNCSFKGEERAADITLADFWGVKKVMPSMYGKEGTSILMINSEKGQELFKAIEDNLEYKEVDINEVKKYNPSMINSVKRPKSRDEFFDNIATEDFDKLVAKNVKEKNNTLIHKTKRIVKKVLIKCNLLEKE